MLYDNKGGVVVIAFLLFFSFFFVSAGDELSSDQRLEARDFIRECFEQLDYMETTKIQKLRTKIMRANETIGQLLSSKQINYRKFNIYEAQIKIYQKALYEVEIYKKSLERPKEKVASWNDDRESEACALYAYMVLSDEWQQYKSDPLNMQVYEQLHKRMTYMAHIVTKKEANRVFVSGTHAYPSNSDEQVNYDVDRVFFLALYLLDKQLKAEREGASSSQ